MTDDARGGVDEGGTKRNLAEPRKVVRILDFTLLQLKSYYEIRKKQRAGGIPSHLGEGRRGGLRSPVTAVSALEGERLPGELEENSEQSSGDGWQTQFDRDASRPASMLRLNSRSACKIDPLPKRSSSMPLCSARQLAAGRPYQFPLPVRQRYGIPGRVPLSPAGSQGNLIRINATAHALGKVHSARAERGEQRSTIPGRNAVGLCRSGGTA